MQFLALISTVSVQAMLLSGVANAEIITGDNGDNGVGSGEDGGDGQPAISQSLDPSNTALGGHGGGGGSGDPPGSGGNGGLAIATASQTATAYGGSGGGGGRTYPSDVSGASGGAAGDAYATASGSGRVSAMAVGGGGGYGSEDEPYEQFEGTGRAGGYAQAFADAVATSSSGVYVTVEAQGGNGGSGVPAGRGGQASASATGKSDFGGLVQVVATQTGGDGGAAQFVVDDEGDATSGGTGGDGAESIMINFVDGYSQKPQGGSVPGAVSLTQIAKGGNAGHAGVWIDQTDSSPSFNTPGVAGNATSTINHFSTHGEADYFAETEAWGGAGGVSSGTVIATPGGQATASTTLQADSQMSSNTVIRTQAEAFGGEGGFNQTINGFSGIAGQGGAAEANAYSEAINGNAYAKATAKGGAGGDAFFGASGVAGIGGSANAEATAITVTGTATSEATGIGGIGGSGGVGGGALGGVASAEATVKAGAVTLSVYDVASNGGTAYAKASLTAPVNGNTTVPNILSRLFIDSSTPHTISTSGGGAITFSKETGVEIKTSGGSHVINVPVIFADDTTVTVEATTDMLVLAGTTTFTPDVLLTKAGAGELTFSQDVDMSDIDLRLVMESGTFTSNKPQFGMSGSAEIAGLLDLGLVDGFEPNIGDSFMILEALGGLTGKFNEVRFPRVDNLSFGIRYLTGVSELHVELEGDLNGDGYVGIDDLSIVFSNWNASVDAGVLLQGDPSGDGFVGIADYNIVLGNWNAGTPPIAGLAIPEPATSFFIAIGSFLAVSRCRGLN